MQSFTTLVVVNKTKIENAKVQIGSTNLYSGLNLITIAAIKTPTD